MYTSIYQNSYVILIISFILLSLICYFFEIGYTTKINNDGNITKKFSWKYPLAISLIIWIFWHFYLYPPIEETTINQQMTGGTNYNVKNTSSVENFVPKTNKLMAQRINMANWN